MPSQYAMRRRGDHSGRKQDHGRYSERFLLAILGRSRWEADALRDMVRDYVVEHLDAKDAVLVIDETGLLKQGRASCGVGRQYTGSADKITKCQIRVFAAYVSRHGYAFIGRALYPPKRWMDDPARMAAAHVPAGSTSPPSLLWRSA